jgi:GNAT superfamily N-acetyltransferase
VLYPKKARAVQAVAVIDRLDFIEDAEVPPHPWRYGPAFGHWHVQFLAVWNGRSGSSSPRRRTRSDGPCRRMVGRIFPACATSWTPAPGRGTSASFYTVPCPLRPEARPAVQLQFMAVEPMVQRKGVGSAVLAEAIRRLKATDAILLWANARDPVLPFYERFGFATIQGSGSTPPETGRPHHIIELDLNSPASVHKQDSTFLGLGHRMALDDLLQQPIGHDPPLMCSAGPSHARTTGWRLRA